MILDAHRLRIWLQKPGLPDDLRETIEWLIQQEEEYQEERERWAVDEEAYQKKIEELQEKKVDTKPPENSNVPVKRGRYEATGKTYDVKDFLKGFGFRWDKDNKIWYLTDEGASSEQIILNVRQKLKENHIDNVDIVFVAAN